MGGTTERPWLSFASCAPALKVVPFIYHKVMVGDAPLSRSILKYDNDPTSGLPCVLCVCLLCEQGYACCNWATSHSRAGLLDEQVLASC